MLRFLVAICAGALLATNAAAETYRLNYDVAVLGAVELGAASFEVASTPTRYVLRANLRTSGFARLFDQTEINASTSGALSPQGLTWTRYDISHAYAGKFRRTRLERAAGIVTGEIAPSYSDMGDPPATTAHQRSSYDPLSAMFALGRQVGRARACTGGVLVFDGRQHYRLSVSGGAHSDYSGGGYSGASVTCQFRYEPIAGFSLSPEERARIPLGEATFGLPEGALFAPLLRLSVPTPLGPAVVALRTYHRAD